MSTAGHELPAAIVHARDPYHRIDILDTSRHIRVEVGGETVADTRRARVLFEASLPPRWYIPREDVRADVLVESDKRTGCAYKGFASYDSVRTSGELEEDLVWRYDEPRREAERIKGYLAFFNERVELEGHRRQDEHVRRAGGGRGGRRRCRARGWQRPCPSPLAPQETGEEDCHHEGREERAPRSATDGHNGHSAQ